jgi:hypothetical protein
MLRRHLFLALLVTLALPLGGGSAQEGATAEGEGTPADSGPPVTTGRNEATAVVGPRGMTFELRNGTRLVIPAGLPTGAGRRINFREARGRLAAASIAEGFTRIGPVLDFDGALNATSSPIVVSIRQPRDPARAGRRLVLAMEQATICREGLEPWPGAAGLCAGWELLDARWEEGRLSANLTTPGGRRLVFGSVPIAAPTE